MYIHYSPYHVKGNEINTLNSIYSYLFPFRLDFLVLVVTGSVAGFSKESAWPVFVRWLKSLDLDEKVAPHELQLDGTP